MFNYVAKDPNSSGLSRELWIKDQIAYRQRRANLVSSNLIVLNLVVGLFLPAGIDCPGMNSTRHSSLGLFLRSERTLQEYRSSLFVSTFTFSLESYQLDSSERSGLKT